MPFPRDPGPPRSVAAGFSGDRRTGRSVTRYCSLSRGRTCRKLQQQPCSTGWNRATSKLNHPAGRRRALVRWGRRWPVLTLIMSEQRAEPQEMLPGDSGRTQGDGPALQLTHGVGRAHFSKWSRAWNSRSPRAPGSHDRRGGRHVSTQQRRKRRPSRVIRPAAQSGGSRGGRGRSSGLGSGVWPGGSPASRSSRAEVPPLARPCLLVHGAHSARAPRGHVLCSFWSTRPGAARFTSGELASNAEWPSLSSVSFPPP